MNIFNVRLGLATNSSSTHDLAFLPEGIQAEDCMGQYRSHSVPMGEFGWQHFTLASPRAKLYYLGTILRERIGRSLPPNIAALVLRDWLGVEEIDEDAAVDHQSLIYLPLAFGTKVPDEQFVKELRDFLLQERLVILGGNDNDEVSHPLKEEAPTFRLPLPRDCSWQDVYVCRYDEQYKFWTMFNQHDGSKLRFCLNNDPRQMHVTPQRASAPELVDVKITNRCGEGCSWCYQNSTPNSLDADSYFVSRTMEALAELKVFEVALGGGEPTIHPDFCRILKDAREVGIIPNFSTRNTTWLRDPRIAHEILENCGAFAYTVYKVQEVEDFAAILKYHGVPTHKATIQVVLGVIDMWEYDRVLEAAHHHDLRVTLLGYKSVGRGENFQPQDYGRWLQNIQRRSEESCLPPVSIDTVLAAEYQEQILAMGIPSWMFTTKEGLFSCYIDLVNKKIGPSSFCKPEELLPLESPARWGEPGYLELVEIIRNGFQSFNL